ncbi:MAG TPA: glycosyltransferase family 4 protein [Verrucomicrobiae bacterium]|nr:glycosyltransferase family 4 protein [Verrucomicrobiae bacterium]
MTPSVVRVFHVITQLELGGAQANTLYTVTHLDRARFEPVLVAGVGGILAEEARDSGVPCRFLPELVRPISPARDVRAYLALKRLFARERPAIVHTHSSKAGILGRLAAAGAAVPIRIHSIHGWGFHPEQPAPLRALLVAAERLAARRTTAFISVSEANVKQGESLGILDRRRARVVHSGIRLGEFSPRPAGTGSGDVVIGMVACFKPQKAPIDFVEVAARVLAAEPGARFVLAGDGELREAIESRIREKGIGGRVTLLGWRRDVPALMRTFDILLHTSRWEGLPRVFAEAMATAIPVVATRVDGAPEAIEEGVNGRLFEPGDVAGMARAVLDLVRDAPLRRRMGRAGLERAGGWDIDEMVREQERIYDDILRAAAAEGAPVPR